MLSGVIPGGTWKGALPVAALALALAGASPAAAGVTHRNGVDYVTHKVAVKHGHVVRSTAACPKHTHVLGGGEIASTGFGTIDLHQTYPVDLGDRNKTPDDGWGVVVRNAGSTTSKVKVYASCGPAQVHYATHTDTIFSETEYEYDLSCPSGDYAYSGGANGPAKHLKMDATFPYDEATPGEKWGSYLESDGTSVKVTSYAVCMHPVPAITEFDIPAAANGHENSGGADCPDGTAVYGGGFASNAGRPSLVPNSMAPRPEPSGTGSFDAFLDVDATFPVEIAIYSTCGPKLSAAQLPPGSPAAAAGTRHHSATATIAFTTQQPYAFYGKVSSGPGQCVVGRKVQLLMGPTGSQEVIATDTTSSNGDWYVTIENPLAGHYQAKVLKKTYKAHGKRQVCDTTRSPGVDDI